MAGLFAKTARPVILAAGRSDGLRHAAERMAVTRKVVDRFVAGKTSAEVLEKVAELRDSSRLVTVDVLGEDVTDIVDATANVRAYVDLIDALGRWTDVADAGVRPFEVSIKLSALGRALDGDGEKIALENARTICERAQQAGVWVTVDAEDHTTTDSTLSIVSQLRIDFHWLGAVLQAYLKRTEGDSRDFATAGARIRLCKGAYDEPASVAFRDRGDVTESYLRCLRVLMAGAGYPMVASHDPVVINAVPAMVAQYSRGSSDFEYQMLFGVRDSEQRLLARAGNQVRVYVPFGTQWYGYFVRRLAERPANLTFFMRALAEGGE